MIRIDIIRCSAVQHLSSLEDFRWPTTSCRNNIEEGNRWTSAIKFLWRRGGGLDGGLTGFNSTSRKLYYQMQMDDRSVASEACSVLAVGRMRAKLLTSRGCCNCDSQAGRLQDTKVCLGLAELKQAAREAWIQQMATAQSSKVMEYGAERHYIVS
jgi:hypothetical protein